jgi:hypothetical protein
MQHALQPLLRQAGHRLPDRLANGMHVLGSRRKIQDPHRSAAMGVDETLEPLRSIGDRRYRLGVLQSSTLHLQQRGLLTPWHIRQARPRRALFDLGFLRLALPHLKEHQCLDLGPCSPTSGTMAPSARITCCRAPVGARGSACWSALVGSSHSCKPACPKAERQAARTRLAHLSPHQGFQQLGCWLKGHPARQTHQALVRGRE